MRSGRYGLVRDPGATPGAAGGKPAGYERAAIAEDDRRCEPRPEVSLLFDPAKPSAAGGLTSLKLSLWSGFDERSGNLHQNLPNRGSGEDCGSKWPLLDMESSFEETLLSCSLMIYGPFEPSLTLGHG